MRHLVLASLAAVLALPFSAEAQDLTARAEALRDKALADRTAYELVESLTTEVGARPVGSPAMARARDWGVAKLKALGFSNVHVEEFRAESWLRGEESAEVTAPYPHKLHILGLARSGPTPKGGIEAEIALFGSLDELMALPPGALKGKIAVVSQPMPKTQDGSGYGFINRNRTQGATEAAKRGAAAYLTRSSSTDDTRLPHTGAMSRPKDAPVIPAAALSPPDAQLLERLVARGQPVRIKLKMENTYRESVPAWNVVGEIPGTEAADELIVIGGHLDAWDPGTGAIDDAAGIAITTAAAKLVAAERPRRTIRVVMWGAEELADSGEAYGAAHKDEVGKMVVVSESDSGDGPIWRVRLPPRSSKHPAMQAFAAAIAPLEVVLTPEPATSGGADVADLVRQGAPVASLSPDVTRYFDLHHSADDTFDKVDPKKLAQSVAVWTSFLYTVAASDIDFRKLAAEAP